MTSKKRLNIAVIGAKGFPARGGCARPNEEIYIRLVKDHNVTVYAMGTHTTYKYYKGIKQIIIKLKKHTGFYVSIYLFLSALHAIVFGNYDIIHVNHLSSGFIVPILKIRYPVLLNARGVLDLTDIEDNKWNNIYKSIFRISTIIGLYFADYITTVQKSSLPLLGSYCKSNLIYIPNGIDTEYFIIHSFIDNTIYLADITFSAARIIGLKGLHILLAALHTISFEGTIRIIGDIDQIPTYKKEIMILAKGLKCEFTGLIRNKEELFKQISNSKLFVFPSFTEGMSNMLLEVAALKVPIIASDITPNKDVFNKEEITFFKTGDIKDLAEKIEYAFNNYSQISKKTTKAFNRLISDYSWDDISKEYIQVLENII